jgi:hypothetical protein
VVLNSLPDYQVNCLQCLLNAYAAFVQGKYANTNKVLKLRWLPVHERRELNLLKLVHKLLYNVTVPENLKLQLHIVNNYNLRSAAAPLI